MPRFNERRERLRTPHFIYLTWENRVGLITQCHFPGIIKQTGSHHPIPIQYLNFWSFNSPAFLPILLLLLSPYFFSLPLWVWSPAVMQHFLNPTVWMPRIKLLYSPVENCPGFPVKMYVCACVCVWGGGVVFYESETQYRLKDSDS